jgi:phytoene synthase
MAESRVPTLAEAQRHCAGVVRRADSSFAAAFWMFPRPQRRALHAIYAFCRLADDIADDPQVRGDRRLLLERWRAELAAAYRGRPCHPVGVALADAAVRFRLPEEVFAELLRGVETDLRGEPIETVDDLRRYCWRVASTVGLLVVRVLGAGSQGALAYAEHMGIAVQLTNVLRDVGEDAAAGRIYLPRQELLRFGVPHAQLRARRPSEELRCLLATTAERARIHYERAAASLAEDERRRLRPAEAMGRIYRELLEELQRRGFPCLEGALRLSRRRRLAIAAAVWLGLGGSGVRSPRAPRRDWLLGADRLAPWGQR